MKPIHLWQRILEHHHVTHIVDFTAGSGALAIAAAGAMDYEGLAANDTHREWLDSTLDRCVVYAAGKDKKFTESLGGDAALAEMVEKYCAGKMREAQKYFEPVVEEADEEAASSASEDA